MFLNIFKRGENHYVDQAHLQPGMDILVRMIESMKIRLRH